MEANQSTNRTYSILTETGNWFLHAEQTQGPDDFGAPIERRSRSTSTSSGATDEWRCFASALELISELVSIDNGMVHKPEKGGKGRRKNRARRDVVGAGRWMLGWAGQQQCSKRRGLGF
jgi:hypothetical protein